MMSTMERVIVCIIIMFKTNFCNSSFVFHENTNVIFQPEYPAEYFGYSILLGSEGLLIGAPKAKDPVVKDIKPGVVFNCSLHDLDLKHVNCTPLFSSGPRDMFRRLMPPDFLRDDIWFGATMVYMPTGRLLLNAPRWTSPYGKKHLLMNGVSYLQSQRGSRVFDPLREFNRQAYVTDGARREYGEYGTHLNFYAYGQAGVSVAVTKMNTVILGAPGLLQWTGGLVSISFYPNDTNTYMTKLPTANPYYTKDLGPDEYFGYSVESGVFEENGRVLYVAGAPRFNIASGKVLVFEPPSVEMVALNIKAKVKGPQSGSYFGASLCCTDINGDGLDDLLVGAPTFVKNDGGLPYDQGAVFVYMTKANASGPGFILEESGYVSGSSTNGAWFGISIADLGDVDRDGFKDIAIGAPWEDDGRGAVYVYKGCAKGLNTKNVQRIQPEDARGFGWSIAKGVDVDNNNCNDLAIGAHNSQTTYLYRCIPTIHVHAGIMVPDAINLPHNATSFTAVFCVSAPAMKSWPHVEIYMIGNIEVDPENNRAMLSGDSNYRVRLTPDREVCDEQTIEVNPTADLSKPISLIFEIKPDELMKENSTIFLMNAARLSDDSTLKTSFLIQLVRDCGEDLMCTPWLVMTLEALENPYIPGLENRLGARITVLNKEEPAYGAKVNITLPMPPKRIPSECSLQGLNMTCDVPAPLLRDEDIVWEIELDYNMNETEDTTLGVRAGLSDPLFRNITADAVKELAINVTHEATFRVSGKSMPNASISISRYNLAAGANVTFKHYFEITNLGPSNSPALIVNIIIPNKTSMSANISGCERAYYTNDNDSNIYRCIWSIPAKVSYPVSVSLQMDLNKEGDFLREKITYNATTYIIVRLKNNVTRYQLTTTLILDPESFTWKLILLCVLLGLLLLAIIVRILYKRGFFQRTTHRMLQLEKDKQELLSQENESTSARNEDEEDYHLEDSD